jgi:hypothetical protein
MVQWILDIKDGVLHDFLLDRPPEMLNGSPSEQLERLRYSTFFGLPAVTSATFNELMSTGKVNLLRSEALRGELGSYYAFYTRLTVILDILPGGYREVVWESLPGEQEHLLRRGLDAEVSSAAFHEGMERLRTHPGLRAAVNHELYYSGGLGEYLAEADRRAVAILQSIEHLYGH